MKRNRFSAAVAALLLSGLLIACGGADNAAETTEATATTQAPAATATKPPPVVAVITAASGGGSGATAGNEGTGNAGAPAMPTAIPTVAPTEAPPTAVPTDTPAPTAVPTARPVVVQPTAVPPTATVAVPPTAVPQVGANGLTASNFAIQPRASLTVNGDIWFEFTVANATGGEVAFDALGVMPRKDGNDRREWYQHSWGGNNDVIPSSGLTWDDHINLPEAGNYTLRLVVCFDGAACKQQKGTWHTLSQEIPITVQ